uniref:Uncharacterized protein n=1 Tax=Cyprinus carpio TaxID=7962 RepID=A0A8C2GQX7_CYPCA
TPANLLRRSQNYLNTSQPAQNPSNPLRESQNYLKPKQKSQLKSNLQYFLGLHQVTHTDSVTCHRPDPPVSKQEKSVFTEKDFQKIQKEYFSNL